MTRPSSQTPRPPALCPPPRIETRRSCFSAERTAVITSATSAHRAISRGLRLIMRVVNFARFVVARIGGLDQLTSELAF